jgi:hypothetical protein
MPAQFRPIATARRAAESAVAIITAMRPERTTDQA